MATQMQYAALNALRAKNGLAPQPAGRAEPVDADIRRDANEAVIYNRLLRIRSV